MAQFSNHNCEAIFTPPAAAVNKVFNTTDGGTKIYFLNKNSDKCLAYYLENNRLKIKSMGGETLVDFVTPTEIEVSNLKFTVVDDLIGEFHSLQPSVTITMDIKAVGLVIHEQRMKIQMTVSSRYYE